MTRIGRLFLTLAFTLSVAAPAGAGPLAAGAMPDTMSHEAASHRHNTPESQPAPCGDCGQPVFCCAHISMTPSSILAGQGVLSGDYIIILTSQSAASAGSRGSLYHPPKAL